MTAEEISAADAAQLLGVKPNTITRYKKDGAPVVVGLACKFLQERRRRAVNTVTKLAARLSAGQRLKRERI
jgi:hypothetical protein